MAKRKARTWEDISEDKRNILCELRQKEKEYLQSSGYKSWKKYFISGSVFYLSIIYLFYIRKQQMIGPKSLLVAFGPIFPFGLTLKVMLFDSEKYKNYYDTHIEINRILRETMEKQEYK
jgi:hypothetical protein